VAEDNVKLPGLDLDRAPMLQMDGIRIATLCVLAVDTLVVVLLAVFLVTNVQSQRQVNECYQNQVDLMLSSIIAGREAAGQDRAAQLAMLNTILDPAAGPEMRRAAVEGWRQALAQGDQTRSSAPVPTQRCAR
jgi:hypothetical protein